MLNSEKQIIVNDILVKMEKGGNEYHKWYVGVAKDFEKELMYKHRIQRTKDSSIIRKASCFESARSIESHFLNLGCAGDMVENDFGAVYVYAYRKSEDTSP